MNSMQVMVCRRGRGGEVDREAYRAVRVGRALEPIILVTGVSEKRCDWWISTITSTTGLLGRWGRRWRWTGVMGMTARDPRARRGRRGLWTETDGGGGQRPVDVVITLVRVGPLEVGEGWPLRSEKVFDLVV